MRISDWSSDVCSSDLASYVPMKPTPGVGQPVDGGWNFQPQVSPVGEQAFTFSHYVLLPVVSGISLLVLGLLLWVIFRYRAGAKIGRASCRERVCTYV